VTTSHLVWRPEPLTARLVAAARPAATEFGALARAKAPSKRVAAGMFVQGTTTTFHVGSTSELAPFFEQGVGPHEIEAKKGPLRLADGSFVSGPVHHPGMAPKPFLHPLLPLWGTLYRRQASGAFRGL
jgi:hypothetical protein